MYSYMEFLTNPIYRASGMHIETFSHVVIRSHHRYLPSQNQRAETNLGNQ